ncbi:hypothetical protein QCD61_28310 (plasmid) [Pseudomonas viciae]|uniref:Transcriptional activator TraM n=1 Tax=Pseudomonas viciae TaxID=2505979 RepID=A0ABY8PMJ3_9PSED|nr:hypothetical protein [Pseudomonas viciae]WGO96403.1 hypothetical protein QCD61_28310 [Pseudomonas viciae]
MDVQRLIGEVAKRHNVLVGHNDPILITLTLNELILGEYIETVNLLLVDAQDQVSAGTAQQTEAAKQIASELITGAAAYIAEQMHTAGDQTTAQMLQLLKAETNLARQQATQAEKSRKGAFVAAMVAATCAALALGLLIGKMFLR